MACRFGGDRMAIINKSEILEAIKPLKKSNYFSHIRYGNGVDFEMIIHFANHCYPKHTTLKLVISHHSGDTSAFVSPFVNGKMKETSLMFTGKKLYEYCLRWIDKTF